MIFYIGGTGLEMEFCDKDEFLREIAMMIDDCIDNGGTYFDIEVNADASCFSEDYKIL